jgi:hypothetical protein
MLCRVRLHHLVDSANHWQHSVLTLQPIGTIAKTFERLRKKQSFECGP